MGRARELAVFTVEATVNDAPRAVRRKLKTALLHNLGMLRAGEPLAHAALNSLETYNGAESASVLHDGTRVHRTLAIITNSAMMHARTQDDTHLPAITHLGATTIAPLIAYAESVDATGEDLLNALLVAYEVGAAVGSGLGPVSSSWGFRPSSVLGAVGASAGVAKLMGLSAGKVASAIGLAASFGGGTGQTWVAGTDEWQYQVGIAAHNGLIAAHLAAAGVVAADDSLEGSSGLYRAFGRAAPDPGMDYGLASTWRTLEVTYKPFPICAINQMPVTILIKMMEELPFDAERMERLELRLTPSEATYPGTDGQPPFQGPSSALMSAPFCLAMAAVEKTATRRMVEDFENPTYTELARRVEVIGDPECKPGEYVVDVMVDGRLFSSKDITAPAPFDWEFSEVLSRLTGMGEELPMSESALSGLANLLTEIEDRSVDDLVEAVTAP